MDTPAHQRDLTGLDLADDVFGDLDDSFEDGEMPRAPRSAEASSLSLRSFRPRSRQSSIIGRNDPPIRPSSRAGTTPGVSSTFDIGRFKRRAREPSILGTARKPRHDTTGSTQGSELGSDRELSPDAESTPLNTRRRTRSAQKSRLDSSVDRSRPMASRKRKSDDIGGRELRSRKTSRVEPAPEPSDSDSDMSSLPSPSALPPPLLERPVTPVNLGELGPPPASSDSEGEDDMWPDIRALAKRRRRPSISDNVRVETMSNISSPPSLTHSPNFAAQKTRGRSATRKRHQKSPGITTADLAVLLPKRRYKGVQDPTDLRSDGPVDTSGLSPGQDELHLNTRRSSRRNKSSDGRSRATNGAQPQSKEAGSPPRALRERQPQAASQRATRSTRTYSLRSANKENEAEDEHEESAFQPLPDDTFNSEIGLMRKEVFTTDELKQATKKFKDVDKWELSFEEVEEPETLLQDAR